MADLSVQPSSRYQHGKNAGSREKADRDIPAIHMIPLSESTDGSRSSKPAAHTLSNILERSRLMSGSATVASQASGGASKHERRADVETALAWLRREMALMRHQDQLLLKQFVDIHNSIHSLKKQQEYQQIPRSLSDVSDIKAWRRTRKTGAGRQQSLTPSALIRSDSQLSNVPGKDSDSDWTFVTSLSHEHVDNFMEQFQQNLATPRMQGSMKGRVATAGRESELLQLDRENSLETDCSEC